MRKYPDEVREVIWALLRKRVRPSEIMRRLAAKEAELKTAYDIPPSTFWDIRRRLIQERGDPHAYVSPEDVPTTLDALIAEGVTLLSGDLDRLRKRARANTGPLSSQDRQAAATIVKTLAELKVKSASPHPANSRAGRLGGQAKQMGPMATLAKRERQTERSTPGLPLADSNTHESAPKAGTLEPA